MCPFLYYYRCKKQLLYLKKIDKIIKILLKDYCISLGSIFLYIYFLKHIFIFTFLLQLIYVTIFYFQFNKILSQKINTCTKIESWNQKLIWKYPERYSEFWKNLRWSLLHKYLIVLCCYLYLRKCSIFEACLNS